MRVTATLCAAALTLGLAACGSSSDSGTNTATNAASGGGGRGAGFFNDPKARECLKQAGIDLPQRPANGQGGPPAGTTNRQGPPPGVTDGQRPPGGRGRGRGGAGGQQFEKLREALKKCGIDVPEGGGFRGRDGRTSPSGPPPAQGEDSQQ